MQIKAIYDKTIFETAKDGIIVALYNLPGEGCKTVKGTMLPSEKGVVYAMDGEWIEHPKYGKQFRCDSYVEDISTEDSIIRFLSSPLIKGIGPVLAKRIVDKFGTDTINIMDNNIEEIRLAKIKGLSPAKFEEMKKSYESQRTVKEVILLAAKYGWSTNIAIKYYKEFKEKTIKVFKETPYELSKIEGISFPTADKIGWTCLNVSAYEMSRGRFQRCAYYVTNYKQSRDFWKIF